LDEYTGVVPPGEDAPTLDDMTADARAAAKKDARYAPLASALTAWAATAMRQQVLTEHGFQNMTASETSELDALNKVADRQFDPLAAECAKTKGR
jgi:hypothetical protein